MPGRRCPTRSAMPNISAVFVVTALSASTSDTPKPTSAFASRQSVACVLSVPKHNLTPARTASGKCSAVDSRARSTRSRHQSHAQVGNDANPTSSSKNSCRFGSLKYAPDFANSATSSSVSKLACSMLSIPASMAHRIAGPPIACAATGMPKPCDAAMAASISRLEYAGTSVRSPRI